MSEVKLINGDCIEEMQKLIDDGVKVDMVLTDPPYGTTACKWDSIVPFDEMWDCIKQLTHPSTPILLFGSEPFSSHLRLSQPKLYKYDWIWNKEVGTNIFNRKTQPLNNYETISVFYEKTGQYYPIMTEAPKKRSFKRKPFPSETYGMKDKRKSEYKDTGLRFPKRIITVNSQKDECNNLNRVHSSQKPVKLLKYLIQTYTKEDDIVLDFTMGSGSTGVACKELNRNFIGIELEPKYYEIAKERINEAKAQRRLI